MKKNKSKNYGEFVVRQVSYLSDALQKAQEKIVQLENAIAWYIKEEPHMMSPVHYEDFRKGISDDDFVLQLAKALKEKKITAFGVPPRLRDRVMQLVFGKKPAKSIDDIGIVNK